MPGPIHRNAAIGYAASYRLPDATAGQLSLAFTFAANTNKQLATIYHAGTALKRVAVRRVTLTLSTGAIGVFNFEIRALSATTAPASGNPAIVPAAFEPANDPAEATCLALPTTAGSLVAADSPLSDAFEWNATTALGAADPDAAAGATIVLFDDTASAYERRSLIMRAGVAEGYAINGRCTAAVALRFSAFVEFTETVTGG